MAYSSNQSLWPQGMSALPSFEEMQQYAQERNARFEAQRKTAERAYAQANKAQIKEDISKFLTEWQKEYPIHDPNRSLVNQLGIFYQLMMSEYPPDINEDITRLPEEISFEAIVHDLGVLTFAVTLPKGMGDKELQKWAQTTFALFDSRKRPSKDSLSSLIWLVCRKIDLAITTMLVHTKTVQAELMKEYEEIYNDTSVTDIINNRHKDHAKRGDILANEFANLRRKLRVRFGDADDSYKAKHKGDFKLRDEVDEEPEEPNLDIEAQIASMRLASAAFHD